MTLRITATHIETWADTRDAQAQLPLLVRRLIQSTAKTTALSMPAGDSINEPGYDGITHASEGNPWVPVGIACWEMGCDARPKSKADGDFAKRVFESSIEEMTATSFVFVTPRRWRQRKEWRQLAAATAPWLDVRVLDADDLEAWIEHVPAVTLWFAELRGLSGPGIESTDNYWQRWRGHSRLLLTIEALLADRDTAAKNFDALLAAGASVITIEADSQEEATAFACVRLAANGRASDAACVSTVDGWRFVDCNQPLHVGIACSPEIAAARAPKDGFTLVVPQRRGDRTEGPLGTASSQAHGNLSVVRLQRPSASTFEQHLIQLGEESSNAARLSRSVGRSWSVYRRMFAKNPAISHPPWLDSSPFIRALSTLTLVGSWNSTQAGDRSCVEAIDGRPYEEMERELRSLSLADDSPVILIGTVWRARSPLELLHRCAPLLTTSSLDRFFSVAEAVLAKPDPALELDPDKRWMAGVYGKVRGESGIVVNAIADSLVKLSVYAERTSTLGSSATIIERVNSLVRRLLRDANDERWLSASGVLREMAEAAPDEFLAAIEHSLRSPPRAVTSLLTESSNADSWGRCWHADLLWALELLAWSPERLHKVSSVLARLSAIPVHKKWGNTPGNSLNSLFRAWWPQTMASSEIRLAVLDRLIRDHSESAWSLMISIIPRGKAWASPNAAPVWREDDAGKASLQGHIDLWYLSEIGARLIAQAKGNPKRIAALIDSLDSFEGEYRESVASLVETAVAFDDDGRTIVRDSLCKYLGWHNSYNLDGNRKSRVTAERLRPMFDRLAPADPVKASLWLFASGWPTLPDGREQDYERHQVTLAQERERALNLVFRSLGWAGITRLVAEAASPELVGREIGRSSIDAEEMVSWLIERRATIGWASFDLLIRGLLAAMSDDKRATTLSLAIEQLRVQGLVSAIPNLLINAPFKTETWQLLESLDGASQDNYWSAVIPGFCRLDSVDASMALKQLIRCGRARTAFQLVTFQPESIDAIMLKTVLEAIRSGSEPDGPLPEGWNIGKALSAIETSGSVSRRDLAMLEFAFFRALEHTEHGTKNLYAELLADPALFMECICLVYKPRNSEPDLFDEGLRTAADLAWTILHSERGIPGKRSDGSIDDDEMKRWVRDVRRLAAEKDRVTVTDLAIGEWLSDCQPDSDGIWPPAAIAEILDDDQHDDLRRGFHTGVINNRGVTSRAIGDGGHQERCLAAQFRERAAAIATRYPVLAGELRSIAQHYERHAHWEDDQTRLMHEGL